MSLSLRHTFLLSFSLCLSFSWQFCNLPRLTFYKLARPIEWLSSIAILTCPLNVTHVTFDHHFSRNINADTSRCLKRDSSSRSAVSITRTTRVVLSKSYVSFKPTDWQYVIYEWTYTRIIFQYCQSTFNTLQYTAIFFSNGASFARLITSRIRSNFNYSSRNRSRKDSLQVLLRLFLHLNVIRSRMMHIINKRIHV